MIINKIFLKGIKIKTIIGIKKVERNNKQVILINCIINNLANYCLEISFLAKKKIRYK